MGVDPNKIFAKRLRIVKSLLLCKAKVDVRNEVTHMTALHWAVFNEDENVVKELLQAGADPYVFSVTCILPIDIAGLCGHKKLVQVLLDFLKDKDIAVLRKEKKKIIQETSRRL